MAKQVVGGQRLFQEQEAERVERPQVGCTGQRVSGVRVGLQRQVRAESVPHRPDRLNVPARLDLELDPPVALLQVTFDLAEQFGHRTGDAHRDPDRDPVPHRPQILGKRHLFRAQLRVQHRRLQRCLGQLMPLDRREHPLDPGRCRVRGCHQHRDQILGHHRPRPRQELRLIQRPGVDGTIRPPLALGGAHAHQQGDPLVLAVLGGPERGDQRQPHHPQLDFLNLHRLTCAFSRRYQPGSITPVTW